MSGGAGSRERGGEEDALVPSAQYRCDSRRKLSTLTILFTESFVQPSALVIASTSSRRGPTHSGCAAR